jgi:hypothetical protein
MVITTKNAIGKKVKDTTSSLPSAQDTACDSGWLFESAVNFVQQGSGPAVHLIVLLTLVSSKEDAMSCSLEPTARAAYWTGGCAGGVFSPVAFHYYNEGGILS